MLAALEAPLLPSNVKDRLAQRDRWRTVLHSGGWPTIASGSSAYDLQIESPALDYDLYAVAPALVVVWKGERPACTTSRDVPVQCRTAEGALFTPAELISRLTSILKSHRAVPESDNMCVQLKVWMGIPPPFRNPPAPTLTCHSTVCLFLRLLRKAKWRLCRFCRSRACTAHSSCRMVTATASAGVWCGRNSSAHTSNVSSKHYRRLRVAFVC